MINNLSKFYQDETSMINFKTHTRMTIQKTTCQPV